MVNFSTIEPDMAETVTAQILDAMRAARVPAPTPELSTELATLRRITAALLDDLPINEWRFAARNGNDVVLGYVAVREIAPLLEALDEAEEED